MPVPDPAKLREAQEELKQGQKALATSLLKWKPDYVEAEPHFQKAARAFKAAGTMDAAADAWRKAADCAYKMGNLKQGAVTLENAGRELSVGKTQGEKVEACRLWAEAAGFLQEAGEVVRSADLKLRAAKLVESFDGDLALRMVDESATLFDGDSDKDVYAVEPLRKILQMQLSLGKHASAMRTMERLYGVWTRLDQKHNLYKLVLSRVILLLAAADPVSAQREYETHLDLDGFTSRDEAAATEDLLQAYTDMNAEEMKKVLERSCFGYLENGVTRIARQLPDAVETGNTVGYSKADEAASKAVNHSKAGPGQFQELGGGTAVAIGRGNASAAEDKSVAKARKNAEKDADARANLFARPAGAAGAGAAAAAAAPEPQDDAFGFGSDDVNAAFNEMAGAADGQEPEAQAGAGGGQGGGEDEFSLM